ncbi:VanZ family protein [Thermomonas flagellata]|uniref:VanZ family protein n=1 Tax=Thermomonas flagellata TaxID=2888524 RepID=UPI001F0411F2|nr:VanZ family protein [Thermomonas flagellata]
MRRVLLRGLLLLVLALVLLAVLVPNDLIAAARAHWAWLNRPMIWIENLHSTVNLFHLLLFALLGAVAALALPAWRARRIALALLLIGIGTEVAQIWIPGRDPRVSDVLIDLLAGLAGWAVPAALRALWVRGRGQ